MKLTNLRELPSRSARIIKNLIHPLLPYHPPHLLFWTEVTETRPLTQVWTTNTNRQNNGVAKNLSY
jgi:hypothetical protein